MCVVCVVCVCVVCECGVSGCVCVVCVWHVWCAYTCEYVCVSVMCATKLLEDDLL